MLFILYVLLVIIIFTLCYLFFAPFYFEINSVTKLVRVRFHKLASAELKFETNTIMLDIKFAWWKKQIDVFAIKKNSNKEFPAKKRKSEKSKRKILLKKIKAVIKSFQVTQCNVSIDTGDVQLNGILYPVFYLMSAYSKKNIKINFTNENVIILEIKNSLARMSWAYIRA